MRILTRCYFPTVFFTICYYSTHLSVNPECLVSKFFVLMYYSNTCCSKKERCCYYVCVADCNTFALRVSGIYVCTVKPVEYTLPANNRYQTHLSGMYKTNRIKFNKKNKEIRT